VRHARQDALRAVEIGEALDSPFLLSHALETLHWGYTQEGFCESAALARRMLEAVDRITDPVEAHENRLIAALALAETGKFAAARDVADVVAGGAHDQGPHVRLHAIGAYAACLAPVGQMAVLAGVSREAPDLALADESQTCGVGSLALAAAVLAAFETGDATAATRALEVFDATALAALSPSLGYRFRALEFLLPIVGAAGVRRRLTVQASGAAHLFRLRLELRVAALTGEHQRVAELVPVARERARSACAPWLAWIATWAAAVTADGGPSVRRARAAAAAFDRYGAPYTAARLLADLLPLLPAGDAVALAGELRPRFEAMGARGSAERVSPRAA
jgi:hypothetical protein